MAANIHISKSGNYIGRVAVDYLSHFVAFVATDTANPAILTITFFDGSQQTLTVTNNCPPNPPGPPGLVFGAPPGPPPPAPTIPNPPLSVIATAGNGQADVSFTAPSNSGGSVITGYTVTSHPSGGTDINAGGAVAVHTVTGLTNGLSYFFTVVATNAVGDSNPSAASNSVTPTAGPPAPPPPSGPSPYGLQITVSRPTCDVAGFFTVIMYGFTSATVPPPTNWYLSFDGVTQSGVWSTGYFFGVSANVTFIPQHAGVLNVTGSFTYISSGNLTTSNAAPKPMTIYPQTVLSITPSTVSVPVGQPFTATLAVASGTSSLARSWRITFDNLMQEGVFSTYAPGTTTGAKTFTPENIGSFTLRGAFWDGTVYSNDVTIDIEVT